MVRLSRRLLARHTAERLLAGASQASVVESLSAYLVDTGRTREADLIVKDIVADLADHGVVLASATTAFGMTDAVRKQIEQFILDETGAKEIILEEQTDPSVLGGVKLSIPGQELDSTIARKLNHLRAE